MNQLPPSVKYIYESFPDKKVFLKEIIPDPEIISAKTSIAILEKAGHKISDYTKDMLTRVDWQEKLKSSYEIVSFSVGELFGDKEFHTYAQIKVKAQESGLDLVPARLAPLVRLNYEKNGDLKKIAMNAIRDRDGDLRVFYCYGDGAGSWLDSYDGHEDRRWSADDRFFFVRK